MSTRAAILIETKSNFAYIYENIKFIKRAEEEHQKLSLLDGHRTYEELAAASSASLALFNQPSEEDSKHEDD